MPRSGILAAGNWIVDHVKLIDAYPEQDALAFIGEQQSSNGGGPYNVLKDLAKLGAEFPLAGAGLVGDDADGRWIIGDCKAHDIDTSRIGTTKDAPTSYTDVMSVSDSGRRTFFHRVGANALLEDQGIELSGSEARYFYLGYLLLLESLDGAGAAKLLRRARGAGFETVVDLVSAQTGDFSTALPALAETDTLFLNEREAAGLLGHKVDATNLTAAAEGVLELGVRKRVVAHCMEGAAWASTDGIRVSHGSVAVPEGAIAGTAGAGDAFAAGVLLGMHGDQSPETCLRWGVCSAALCLSDPTTSGGLDTWSKALQTGEKYGFRTHNQEA